MISEIEFKKEEADLVFSGKKIIVFSKRRLVPGTYTVIDPDERNSAIGSIVIFGGKEFSSIEEVPPHFIENGCETVGSLKNEFGEGSVSINYISYAKRQMPVTEAV